MNHYIIKSEGGTDRVHSRAESFDVAVKDCFIYVRAATTGVVWYVLSTERSLVVGRPVGEVPS